MSSMTLGNVSAGLRTNADEERAHRAAEERKFAEQERIKREVREETERVERTKQKAALQEKGNG